MRVLVLGAAGMLGHKMYQTLDPDFEVHGAVRGAPEAYARFGVFHPDRLRGGVDAFRFDSVVRAVAELKPKAVINCVGVVKQRAASRDPVHCLTLNAVFPHKLKNLCRAAGARLVQISTDCVFSGARGRYVEDDVSDATDLYGRSKSLGEVDDEGCLTLRVSIIGRELTSRRGLVEWFLSNEGGEVGGYVNAVFSGLSTLFLAQTAAALLKERPGLSGLYHVSADPISKYELLGLLRQAYGANVAIRPEASLVVDRSLDSGRFRAATGFAPPAWPEMVRRMAGDPTPYDLWK